MTNDAPTLVHVTDDTFETEVLKSPLPVLVDFYADWCAPCKAAEPVLVQLSLNLSGRVKFTKVNVDESGSLTRSYGIHSIPTYLFVEKGQERGRELALSAPTEFRTVLKRYFSF
ncbi:MAG: thioredoxin domain-containing protein [Thermoplasmata archaeon]|nr:thioredoxin domain-containing protein [Thermoplasmata archaeon]MCI4340907.1 thioredoxin domain-containing protein [Thermoplasmata archaeon]